MTCFAYLFWYYVYYKINLCMWRNENNYRKVWSRKWIHSIIVCCSPSPQTPDHMCVHDGFGGWLLDGIGDTELSKFHSSGRQSIHKTQGYNVCREMVLKESQFWSLYWLGPPWGAQIPTLQLRYKHWQTCNLLLLKSNLILCRKYQSILIAKYE